VENVDIMLVLEGFKRKKRKTFGSRIKLFVMGPAPQAGPIKDS
jgi:hypothetical protein